MNKLDDDGAPCRMPHVVQNAVDILSPSTSTHDVMVNIAFKAFNIICPIPHFINFFSYSSRNTLSYAFSISKQPTYKVLFVFFTISIRIHLQICRKKGENNAYEENKEPFSLIGRGRYPCLF